MLGDEGTQLGKGQVEIGVRSAMRGHRDFRGGDNQGFDPAHFARGGDGQVDGGFAGFALKEAFIVKAAG
jgi:hypothetical protein